MVSIVLSPALLSGAGRVVSWIERVRPPVDLVPPGSVIPEDARPPRHAVICGYGRVGQTVGAVLQRRGLPFAVIDHNPRVVKHLREEGITAWIGNASNPVLLRHADLERARVLIVALPDALVARQAIVAARQASPSLHIIARTHSDEDTDALVALGVDEAVLGERELALEMARFTLRRFGVSAAETFAIVQGIRLRSGAGQSPASPVGVLE